LAKLEKVFKYRALDKALLCCAVLCCAVLCCAVLCCAVLCCAVLCYAMLCYAMLCYAMIFFFSFLHLEPILQVARVVLVVAPSIVIIDFTVICLFHCRGLIYVYLFTIAGVSYMYICVRSAWLMEDLESGKAS
jgi:hypothetical protein